MSYSSYATEVAKLLQNQEVEIYCGDHKNIFKFSDYDYVSKNIIQGKILQAQGDCLIVEVNGDKIYLNSWGIKAITPINQKTNLNSVFSRNDYEVKSKK